MGKKKPFTLHVIESDPPLEPLKVILPDDGTDGMVIGEDHEVRALYNLLETYLKTGTHDGEIPDYHEQLGGIWLTSCQAVDLAARQGIEIPERTITWAALHGFIRGASKSGRDWRFPQRMFLHWLSHRPKPGRKTSQESTHA